MKYIEIKNRRYLGNKYKLLPFITDTIKKECENFESFADIFSGTGSVASAYIDKQIVTNDILYSNYICNFAWFGSKKVDMNKIEKIIKTYNLKNYDKENYMTDNFSDTFFCYEDCLKIGCIREDIEKKYRKEIINEREKAVLIMALLYSMDRIANTCGHYDAYIRGKKIKPSLEIDIPNVSNCNNKGNKCYNEDANQLVRRKDFNVDLVYIDPPYNSRQYSDAYHLLENVATWKKPEVFGVAKKMDRSNIKSKYCTNEATTEFEDLINNINAKYIVLSYNNTGNKSNERSNARISDIDIINILSEKGKLAIYNKDYKAFTTGKSKNDDNKERLFICKVG